jgi:hypothetical protein
VAAAQLDDAAREAVADYVVRNDDGIGALERAAGKLWAMLQEDARLLTAGEPLPARRGREKKAERKGKPARLRS